MMHVSMDFVTVVKPGIIRVSLYTILNKGTEDEKIGPDYEIAVLEDDFITREDNEVQIDLDKLQLLLSNKIAEMQFTANLAKALQDAQIEWDINDTVPNNENTENTEDANTENNNDA